MDNAHFHIAAGNFNSQNSVFQHWKNRKEVFGIEKGSGRRRSLFRN